MYSTINDTQNCVGTRGKLFIVYNAPKKQPPIRPVKKKYSNLVRENPEKSSQVVPKKMSVDTVTRS